MAVETKTAPVSANGKATDSPSKWAQLREPFPSEDIGKLPATQKRPELDYVSHAHVTDRLLQVDPTWYWDWGVKDPESGRPSKFLSLTKEEDGSISLWMALTVNGVTRIDVGYVSSGTYGMPDEPLKHVISDALRRCAMRHGVALDLWMKTEAASPSGRADVGIPSSDPCPVETCSGHLVQRTGQYGLFVSCTDYASCGFKPENGTIEEYRARQAESADAADAPPTPALSDVDYIRSVWQKVNSDKRLEAFGAGQLVACLGMNSKNVWVLRADGIEKLKVAPQDRVHAVAQCFRLQMQDGNG